MCDLEVRDSVDLTRGLYCASLPNYALLTDLTTPHPNINKCMHDAVFRPLGLTNRNNDTQHAALDFVKPGQLINLLCKGMFPQEGESACSLSS